MLIPWLVAAARAPKIARPTTAPTWAYLTDPQHNEYPVAVPVQAWQTMREANAVGRFTATLPVDRVLDEATSIYTSAIETGWEITLVHEFNGPHGRAGAMLTKGVVQKHALVIGDGGASIILSGSFKGARIARVELHEEQVFHNQSAQGVAGTLLGAAPSFAPYLKDTTIGDLTFKGGTRLAGALKVGEIARWTLRETWSDDWEFVGVDQAPDSGFQFVAVDSAGAELADIAAAGYGIIADRPTVDWEGGDLCNRVIPIGVDGDGGDLTLEHAAPAFTPYPILSDLGTFYLEDTVSQLRYGLWERKFYWGDVRNPERFPATGLLILTVNPTDGDSITVGTQSYTFKNAPSALGHIFIGSDVFGSRQNLIAAFAGQDGLNTPNPDVQITTYDATSLQIVSTKAKGTDGNFVATTGSFTNPANGFSASALAGGAFSVATATVLYWRAVNELVADRSEVFMFHSRLANGADIWALPGDRVRVRYQGFARTVESGGTAFTWINVDRDMLLTARMDGSDPSGVRQVDFTLSCPSLAYPVPGIPSWGGAVALPVPKALPIPGPLVYKDAGMARMIANIASRVGMPVSQCCPDPNVTHTAGGSGELDPDAIPTGGAVGSDSIGLLNYPHLAADGPRVEVLASPTEPFDVGITADALGPDQAGVLIVAVANRANPSLTTANHFPGGGDYLYIGNQATPVIPTIAGLSSIASVTFRAQQAGSYTDPVDSAPYSSDGDDARLTVFRMRFEAGSCPSTIHVNFGGAPVPDVMVFASVWPLPDALISGPSDTHSGGAGTLTIPALGATQSAIVFATGNVGVGGGSPQALGAASANMTLVGSIGTSAAGFTAGWLSSVKCYKVQTCESPITIDLDNIVVPGAGGAMIAAALGAILPG